MNKDMIKEQVRYNVICFLNTFCMHNDSKEMRNCIERNAENITAYADIDRSITIQTIVETICDTKAKIVYRNLSDILNLVLYTGLYWKAHRVNLATHQAIVYLTPRDGTHYELIGNWDGNQYNWTYQHKAV